MARHAAYHALEIARDDAHRLTRFELSQRLARRDDVGVGGLADNAKALKLLGGHNQRLMADLATLRYFPAIETKVGEVYVVVNKGSDFVFRPIGEEKIGKT